MILLLKSLILLQVSVLVTSTNYCKVQEKFCGFEKHVGCSTNTFEDLDFDDFQMIQITEEIKSTILDELNTARNETAFAEVRSPYEIKNMRYLNWNDEFEYLMELSIKNVQYNAISCAATEEFLKPNQFNLKFSGKISDENFIAYTLRVDIERALHTPHRLKSLDYVLDPETYSIGCAFAKYYEINETVTIAKCLTNKVSDGEIVYDYGKPCSGCPTQIECNNLYTGLCGHHQFFYQSKFEKIINDFDETEIGYNVDYIFWILIVILAFGLIFSLCVKIKHASKNGSQDTLPTVYYPLKQ